MNPAVSFTGGAAVMDDDFDIAIVGIACRFPGAKSTAEFWSNLANGVESIARLSDGEILESGVPRSHLDAPNYVKAAPVLDRPGAFDAAFFGYTPAEARVMDPQHRILLELAHEALEDAGCVPSRTRGRVGVFAGAAMNTWFMHAGLADRFSEDYIPTLIANDKDFLATRISYKLDLKGPSITVQTACSTSLVAVHLARQSLLSEECDVALAGAVSVRVPHRAGYFSDAGGVTSPDGHVRAFDADANGTVFGSGGGVIVMKRLRDAIADGDCIRAIIKGSAINNDGAGKAGYTAPGVNSQADAIIEALSNADVAADSISYIEAHGSGTPVGDPIEMRALTKAFRASSTRTGFCAIGSVKTNIGHLDAAAGMAGLIKTVLALQHRQIPASLNYSRPNPEIDFAATPFFVNAELTEWKSDGPRRAGIMSTGMGGTNAHVVLEEAPPAAAGASAGEANLLVISARTEAGLAAASENLRGYLERNPSLNLRDVASTLQLGRRELKHRRFVVAADTANAISALAAKPPRLSVGVAEQGTTRPLVLMLPGIGDHYVGMGRELYTAFAVFRSEVDRCAEILRPLLGHDIRDVLWPRHRDWKEARSSAGIDLKKMLAGNTQPPEDDDSRRLNEITNLQPALFTIEFALAKLWIDLVGEPKAILAHSMGEYVAASLSGVFALEDSLRLITRRTQLVAALPHAKMLAVTLPEAELAPLLTEGLSIALINGPALCIVAGPPDKIDSFAPGLEGRGITCRPVQNTHAFHSKMLTPIARAFADEVRKVRAGAPRIPFTSNVTGRWITPAEAADPEYWARHLDHTARFSDALHTLWQMEAPLLVECGPGRTLGVLASQHPGKPSSHSHLPISSIRHHYENQRDAEVLSNAIGRLWLTGREIRWERLHGKSPVRKVPLPTYPFERQDYWLDARTPSQESAARPKADERALTDFDDWFYVPSWERTVSPEGGGKLAAGKDVLWLIFCRNPAQAAKLRTCLEATPASVRIVNMAGRFQQGAGGGFEVNPASPEDYLGLFREIKTQPCREIRIIHLGCAGSAADADDLNLGFFSLLFIARAISELGITTPMTVGVVSTRMHDVTGDENLRPRRATVLGPCAVIPKEFPNITCFNLDLPDELPAEKLPDDIAQRIVCEFGGPARDEVIALRGPHRWRKKYDRLPRGWSVPAGPENQPTSRRLRARGVYVITGGTGGIGMEVAKFLAETCKARLVLTRKSAFPEKPKWTEMAGRSDTPAATVELITQLLELESFGAEVDVVTAEGSDLQTMRQVFDEARRRHGAVHGVIHAAGIVRDGLIAGKSREVAEVVMAPKVRGCEILHQLSKEAGADFLVLFSSTASVLGPAGQVDYSAANAFLDAFSHFASRDHGSPHTVAINWPGWREVGILAKMTPAPGMEHWKADALRKAISTADGLEAFRRALEANLPQIIVSPMDLCAALEESRRPHAARVPGGMEPDSMSSTTEGPAGAPQAPLRVDQFQDCVIAVWKQVLGFDQVGPDESFFELGGHSLLLIQVHRELCRRLGREISLLALFQNPTPRTLAQHLATGAPSSPGVDKARLRAERQRQALATRNPRR